MSEPRSDPGLARVRRRPSRVGPVLEKADKAAAEAAKAKLEDAGASVELK